MIKGLGVTLIFVFCCFTGESIANRHIKEYKALASVCDMLMLIKSMIECGNMTLSELFIRLKGDYQLSSLAFLQDETELNTRESIAKSINNTPPFENREYNTRLKRLIELLGTTDKQGQLDIIESMLDYFNTQLVKTREELPSKKRLYRSLGFISGAFAAVILI